MQPCAVLTLQATLHAIAAVTIKMNYEAAVTHSAFRLLIVPIDHWRVIKLGHQRSGTTQIFRTLAGRARGTASLTMLEAIFECGALTNKY